MGVMEYFFCFIFDFFFFEVIAIGIGFAIVREEIESDLVLEFLCFNGLVLEVILSLLDQFMDSLFTGSTDGLISGHEDFINLEFFFNRGYGHTEEDCAAIWISDESFMESDVSLINFWDNERDFVRHSVY